MISSGDTSSPTGKAWAIRLRSFGIRPATVWAGLAAALVLSVFLAVGLCTEACKATYQWTIFGMKFPVLGIGFFTLCLLMFHLRDRPVFRGLLPMMLSGAAGAELT